MRFTKSKFKVAMTVPKPHWREVECHALQAPKWKPLKLCVHKEQLEAGDGKKWAMSDMTTGLRISQFTHPTRDEAIKEGLERLGRVGYKKVVETLEERKKILPPENSNG